MQINLTPDYSLLAIMVIFILNYLIVRKFFLQPINQVIEARETEVRSANEIYEQSMLRFQEATTQMEEKLHAARHAAADVRDRFRREAAAYRTSVVTKTHDDANGIVSEADAEADGRRRRGAGEDRHRVGSARASGRGAHPREAGLMRRAIFIILLLLVPAMLFAQTNHANDANNVAQGAEKAAHEQVHPNEAARRGA